MTVMAQKNAKDVIKEFLISLFSVLVIIYILFNFYTLYAVWNASKQLTQIPQQEYIRFTIYGSSSSNDGNTISASFSIVDTNGNEISKIERSWTGNYLAVEFARLRIDGKYFVFPSRIYGKNRVIEERRERSRGTLLEKYYDDYGQCMLLGYGSSLKQRKQLYRIASFATGKFKVFTFGLVTRFSIDLSSCRPDRYYSISFNADGSYVLEEL